MKINNPQEFIGKEVTDVNGNTMGYIDKWWNSWNTDYPGYFFGVRPTENSRDTWFRGTSKLIPIYSDYVKEFTHHITLNKTLEDFSRFWNKAFPCGQTTCTTDEITDKTVYDKNHSRVGTFYGWVESDGTFKNYGCFVDPYICDTWKVPHNIIMPMPIDSITNVKDTILLNKTLDELKQYWQKYHQF